MKEKQQQIDKEAEIEAERERQAWEIQGSLLTRRLSLLSLLYTSHCRNLGRLTGESKLFDVFRFKRQ